MVSMMDTSKLLYITLQYGRANNVVCKNIPIPITAEEKETLISFETVRSTFQLDGTSGIALMCPLGNFQIGEQGDEETYFEVEVGETYVVHGAEKPVNLKTPSASLNAASKTTTTNPSTMETVSLVSPTSSEAYDKDTEGEEYDVEEGDALCSQEVSSVSWFPNNTRMVSALPEDIDGDVVYGCRLTTSTATTIGKTPWFNTKRPWRHADEASWKAVEKAISDRCTKITVRRSRCNSDVVCTNSQCPHALTFGVPYVQQLKLCTKGKNKEFMQDNEEGPQCKKCFKPTSYKACNAILKTLIAQVLNEHGGGSVLLAQHSGVHQCHITASSGKQVISPTAKRLLEKAFPAAGSTTVNALR